MPVLFLLLSPVPRQCGAGIRHKMNEGWVDGEMRRWGQCLLGSRSSSLLRSDRICGNFFAETSLTFHIAYFIWSRFAKGCLIDLSFLSLLCWGGKP